MVRGGASAVHPNINDVVNLGGRLFDEGVSYSAINTACSALSSMISINQKPVRSHPVVIHFLKGVFNTRPTLPKTNITWDPRVVLDYLKTIAPAKQLSLKRLTLKMVTLLWLVTGQTGQSIQLIDFANLTVGELSKFVLGSY